MGKTRQSSTDVRDLEFLLELRKHRVYLYSDFRHDLY